MCVQQFAKTIAKDGFYVIIVMIVMLQHSMLFRVTEGGVGRA